MLNEEELKDASLLVFANKQDQPGAKGAGEISEALRLGELRDRNWSIMACSAVDGSGVTEGMDWLVVSAPGRQTTQTMTTTNASSLYSKPSLRSKPFSSITEATENLIVPTDDEYDFQHKKNSTIQAISTAGDSWVLLFNSM